MALLINKKLNILGTVPIDNFYVRLELRLNREGDRIIVRSWKYSDKEAYNLNRGNNLRIETYYKGDDDLFDFSIPYNREEDGIDILTIAHKKLIERLTTDITKEKEVVRERFCELDQITNDLEKEKEIREE